MDKDRIIGSAKNAAGKAEGVVGDAVGNRSTQASGRAMETEGVIEDLYGQAKDVARDTADAATKYVRQFRDDGTEAVAEMVRENPIRALWVAGGIGFALALMFLRPPR